MAVNGTFVCFNQDRKPTSFPFRESECQYLQQVCVASMNDGCATDWSDVVVLDSSL